jgi:hypothetical protein
MKNKEFFAKGLPKWPAIVVVGDSVTAEQAAEIIIRTNTYLYSNEREFVNQAKALIYGLTLDDPSEYDADVKAIEKILGISAQGPGWNKIYEYREAREKELGVLDINYLSNHRICSAWIGGPHGWCDWDGTIGCHNYNIGKWPTVEEVYHEWCTIAKAFPFLELRCQLMNHEASCEEMAEIPGPVVEFRVSKGRVRMVENPCVLRKTEFTDLDIAGLMRPGAEIGCTLETLKDALDIVRGKFA